MVGVRRGVLLLAAVLMGVGLLSASANAATSTGTVTRGAAIRCGVSPGHYCAKVLFVSVHNGIRVTETKSTGYTQGPGRGREYFRYSCTAGTCFILPSPLFVYNTADVQLNVVRRFSGTGKFLPCGNVFGVQYFHPAVNAPRGAVLFQVTCGAGTHSIRMIRR